MHRLLISLFALVLAACDQEAMFDKFVPKEEAALAKQVISQLAARDYESVEAHLEHCWSRSAGTKQHRSLSRRHNLASRSAGRSEGNRCSRSTSTRASCRRSVATVAHSLRAGAWPFTETSPLSTGFVLSFAHRVHRMNLDRPLGQIHPHSNGCRAAHGSCSLSHGIPLPQASD